MNICRKLVFDKCTAQDWVTISLFLVLMGISVTIAVTNVATEQTLKEKYNNINLVKSDLVFKGATLK